MLAEKSIRIILNGYKKLECQGTESYSDLFESFLLASNYVNTSLANVNQNIIEDKNIKFNIENGKEYEYISNSLKECLSEVIDNEESLKFGDLLSLILDCDKNHIYDALVGILKKVVFEQVN